MSGYHLYSFGPVAGRATFAKATGYITDYIDNYFVNKDELMLPRLDYSFAMVGLVWPQLNYSVATVGLVLPRLGWCCCGWTGVATVGLVLPWLD